MNKLRNGKDSGFPGIMLEKIYLMETVGNQLSDSRLSKRASIFFGSIEGMSSKVSHRTSHDYHTLISYYLIVYFNFGIFSYRSVSRY